MFDVFMFDEFRSGISSGKSGYDHGIIMELRLVLAEFVTNLSFPVPQSFDKLPQSKVHSFQFKCIFH